MPRTRPLTRLCQARLRQQRQVPQPPLQRLLLGLARETRRPGTSSRKSSRRFAGKGSSGPTRGYVLWAPADLASCCSCEEAVAIWGASPRPFCVIFMGSRWSLSSQWPVDPGPILRRWCGSSCPAAGVGQPHLLLWPQGWVVAPRELGHHVGCQASERGPRIWDTRLCVATGAACGLAPCCLVLMPCPCPPLWSGS